MKKRWHKPSKIFKAITLALAVSCVLNPVHAEEADEEQAEKKSTADILSENIVVTVRKRTETLHETPVAVTALGEEQLDALKIRDLNDLSDGMANVMLEDIGTTRGTANFSIRGLGVNSSIPSIDPTVGVFVDGIYMGTNSGIIMDMFDIESIQVLRGPQGILFGRNVTGGAILIETKKPEDSFAFKGKASLAGGGDGGLNRTIQANFDFPLSENLFTKLSVYYNDDEGYFKNLFDGSDHGAIEQTMIRSTTLWEPTEDLSITFKYENMDAEGDGPSSQNHTNGSGINPTLAFAGSPLGALAETFDRDSHDFSIDDPGYQNSDNELVAINLDWDVAGGKLNYIFGYRDYASDTRGDIDAQPFPFFHSPAWLRSEQFSNEIRFNKELDSGTNITFGAYQYSNDLEYHERRELPFVSIGIIQDGGGIHETTNASVFAAADFEITEQLTALIGGRYTKEKKDAQIASLSRNVSAISAGFPLPQGPTCNIVLANDCAFDFEDDDEWTSFSPKLGLTYTLNNGDLLYGHWSKGFRSGGYNLRNTADTSTPELLELSGPGPFDQEEVSNFEFGYKHRGSWGHINASVFYMTIDDMQREVNTSSDTSQVVQVIKNTAEVTMKGLEVDGLVKFSDSLVGTFNLGLINSDYDEILFDISGDGVINNEDFALEIPRVPETTFSIGLSHDADFGSAGYLNSRISYSYRDKTFYTDNNLGFIDEQKTLNVGFDFHSGDNWIFSVFGKNLTDEVKHGNDTQLPFGTFSPLAKGRIIGAEVTYTY